MKHTLSPRQYAHQEYPRMVYGPNGERKRINSEDEWPDGYMTHPDAFTDTAAVEAAEAEKSRKEAEKAERDEIKRFLDEHNVDYAKNLGLDKLRALSDQLTEHLRTQGQLDPETDGYSE